MLASASAGCVAINDKLWCRGCGGEGVHCYVREFLVMSNSNAYPRWPRGRFTFPGSGRAIATNPQQAATLYPMHMRSTKGMLTLVGTKLGFYKEVVAARGNHERDPNGMIFGISGEEEEAQASYVSD